MSKFKAGDKVVRVKESEFGTMKKGDVAIVNEVYGLANFSLVGCGDFTYDMNSYELFKEPCTLPELAESLVKAKEVQFEIKQLQLEISVRQKELEEHLNVLKEHGVQLIEGAKDVA